MRILKTILLGIAVIIFFCSAQVHSIQDAFAIRIDRWGYAGKIKTVPTEVIIIVKPDTIQIVDKTKGVYLTFYVYKHFEKERIYMMILVKPNHLGPPAILAIKRYQVWFQRLGIGYEQSIVFWIVNDKIRSS